MKIQNGKKKKPTQLTVKKISVDLKMLFTNKII